MIRKTVLLTVFVLMGSVLIVHQSNNVVATNERNWIIPGKDYTFGDGVHDGILFGPVYLRVNESDLITINWKSGTVPSNHFYAIIGTNAPAINYSGNWSQQMGSSITAMTSITNWFFNWNYFGSTTYWGSSPHSEWVRMGSNDLISIFFSSGGSPTQQTFNITIQREIPDLNVMNISIVNLTANLNALNASMNASINALNTTFTNALNATNNLLYLTNATITANLTGLWSSYIDNITATNNQIQSDYQALMDYTNQSFDTLMQNLNALDNYVRSLNTSYQENLSLIHAYMNFTNASINLLNSDLTLLNQKETNDTNSIIADLNALRNYTNRANDIMTGLINLTNSNASNRDNTLNDSIHELQTMTNNLTVRAGNIENQVNINKQTATTDLNAEINRLNDVIKTLTDNTNANATKLNNQIADAKKESINNTGLAIVFSFIAGMCITWAGIRIHGMEKTGKKKNDEYKPIDDDE
jgi:hypothetical protein